MLLKTLSNGNTPDKEKKERSYKNNVVCMKRSWVDDDAATSCRTWCRIVLSAWHLNMCYEVGHSFFPFIFDFSMAKTISLHITVTQFLLSLSLNFILMLLFLDYYRINAIDY